MHVLYLLPEMPFADGRELFFERFFAAVEALDETVGEFVECERQQTATQIKTSFSDDEDTTRITIWEDFVAEVRYYEIAAPDQVTIEAIRAALAEEYVFVDHDALVRMAEDCAPDAGLFYRIADSAPVLFYTPTFEVIRSGLRAPLEEVREAAATAAGLIGWAEFLGPLSDADRDEGPGAAKQAMQNALRALD